MWKRGRLPHCFAEAMEFWGLRGFIRHEKKREKIKSLFVLKMLGCVNKMSEENMKGEGFDYTDKKHVDELMIDIMSKSKDEIAAELYLFYKMWDVMDEETKYLLSNLNQMFGITQRNYNRKVGVLTKVFFQPTRFFITTYEKLYDGTAGDYMTETKEWSVLASMVLAYSRIFEREIAKD